MAELDPVIHARTRLRVVTTLAALPAGSRITFTRLQELLGMTPGNLITHLRKLADAGYVRSEKSGSGRSSTTSVALTEQGRSALHSYAENVRALLETATGDVN